MEYYKKTSSKSIQNSPAHFVPLSSLPLLEAAFSIEKIRQKIWSYTEPKDFFTFRLVSRAWRRYATNAILLNWKKNKITTRVTVYTDESKKPRRSESDSESEEEFESSSETESGGSNSDSESESESESEPNPLKTLRNLLDLMDKTGANVFPCSNFVIHGSNKKQDELELQEFLNKHGSRINKLYLKFTYYKACKEENIEEILCSCGQSWVKYSVTKLLTIQAPNLEKLKFNWKILKSETTTEATCKNYISDTANFPPILNLNLRSISFGEGYIETSLFERICTLAPKLDQFTTINVRHYLEPVNRLYLLKKLLYDPIPWNGEQGHGIVKQLANMEGELGLNELTLKVRFINTKTGQFNDMWPDVADVCNKLLEKSCSSLKKLWVEPMGFLPGMKIPQMPHVTNLHYLSYDGVNPYHTFFPRGTRICQVFPNLHSIQLPENYITEGRMTEIALLGGVPEVINSVKVIIQGWAPIDEEKLKQFFPNARIII